MGASFKVFLYRKMDKMERKVCRITDKNDL